MTLKGAVRVAGWVVSLACLGFFISHVSRVGLSIPHHSTAPTLAVLAGGALTYSAGVGLLAIAWWRMLRSDSGQPASGPLMVSYLVGQFAKYLPGNVFQYAARHGLGVAAGASHGTLVAAAFSEICLLLCCGAAVALAAGGSVIADVFPGVGRLPGWLALAPLSAALAVSIPGNLLPKVRWLPRMPIATVAAVCSCYLAFFLLFGVLYFACLAWVNVETVDVPASIGAAAMAWVAGFVIPGPPAGAGVREATLTLGAGPGVNAAAVATSILMFRTMTLCGDFLAFVGGSLLGSRLRRRSSQTVQETSKA